MTLDEIVQKLGLGVENRGGDMDTEITRGYIGDLLSNVMAHAQKGDIWVTIQVHQNIVAVAALKEVAAIIVAGGRKAQRETLEAAEKQNVTLLTSDLPAFEIAGRLYAMGVKGL